MLNNKCTTLEPRESNLKATIKKIKFSVWIEEQRKNLPKKHYPKKKRRYKRPLIFTTSKENQQQQQPNNLNNNNPKNDPLSSDEEDVFIDKFKKVKKRKRKRFFKAKIRFKKPKMTRINIDTREPVIFEIADDIKDEIHEEDVSNLPTQQINYE